MLLPISYYSLVPAATKKQPNNCTWSGYYSPTKKEPTTATSYLGYATSYQTSLGNKEQQESYAYSSIDLTYLMRLGILSRFMRMPIRRVLKNGAINVSKEQENTSHTGSNILQRISISLRSLRAHGI